MTFKKYLYPAALILIMFAGLIIRLLYLSKVGSYWFDEIASLIIARLDFPKIWEYLIMENNPPLSFLFLHFWIKLFGEGEKIVRISSLIFSIASIAATYFIGKEIFSKKTGLLAAFFMSLSFFQVFYSAEAKMYSLFQFLALCSIYFFWKVLNENKKINWIFYTASSLLLIYTHIFAWLILIFQNIFLLIYRKDYAKIKNKILAINLLILTFFFTWFIPKIQTFEFSDLTNAWYFKTNYNTLSNILSIGQRIIDLIYETAPNKLLELPLVILIILLGISAFLLHIKNNRNNEFTFLFHLTKPLLFVSLWMAIPLIMLFLFFPSGTSKYVIFVGPALYLLIARGINKLKLKPEIIISIILFISLAIFSNTFNNIKNTKQAYVWNKVAEYISKEEKPEDKIILHSFVGIFEFRQYYKGKNSYEGFYIFDNNDELDKMILRRNWNTVILEKDYPNVDKKMKTATSEYKRIFLIEKNQQTFDPYNLILKWFYKNNWHLIKTENFNNNDPIILIWGKND